MLDLIDDGALTWRQVVESPDRPEVAAAYESMSRILPPSDEKLAEIFPDPDPETGAEPEPAVGTSRRRIMTWPN